MLWSLIYYVKNTYIGVEMNIENDLNKYLEELKVKLADMFAEETSGHDISHLTRTLNLALHLQEKEGGDKWVIATAALLHDMHRLIQFKTGKYCLPADSLSEVQKILEAVDFPKDKVEKILSAVKYHEEYDFSVTGKAKRDIETLILQDADNLEAMGAIGVVRTFSVGAIEKLPFWDPTIPIDNEIYEIAVLNPTTIHHFYTKLLKLKDNMNTETGKKLALHRHKYMELFLEEFFKEWEGEI